MAYEYRYLTYKRPSNVKSLVFITINSIKRNLKIHYLKIKKKKSSKTF